MAVAVALFAFIASDAQAEGSFPTGVAAPTSTETCPSSPRVDGLAPGVQPPAWAEHQFVHFFMRPQTSGACLSAGVAGEHGETLQYQGGPVQHSPQLYLLFWGSNFESSVGLRLSEAFHLFYGNLKSENEVKGSTAAWQGIVDQYWSNEGPFYHNAQIAAEGHITSVTAPKNVTYALLDKTISEWVESVKTNYHLTPNGNAQFVVLTAPGSTFTKEVLPEEEKHGTKYFTCGFHKTTGPYTGEHKNEVYSYSLVPYNGDSHCGEEGTKTETEEEKLINGTTDTASHEFAEAVTDPNSSREYASGEADPYTSSFGWTGKEGNEIADECEAKSGARLPYRSWVTLLWDDLGGYAKGSPEGECKLEDPPYPALSAPSATTGSATGITYCGAIVAGTVNPNGPDAHYYFEYGPTTSYGTKIPVPPGNDAGFGTTAVPVSVTLGSLTSDATYHYRIVASSWVGTSYGADQMFTTLFSVPTYSSQWGTLGSGSGQFKNPSSDAIDASGNVWVTDFANARVKEFSASGELIRTISGVSAPSGIAINKGAGLVYVADFHTSDIDEFSASNGKLIRRFSEVGIGKGQMITPTGVGVDSSGNVWVSDYGNFRIDKFSSTGAFIADYGSYGSGQGQYNQPQGITIDSSNHVYIADEGNDRVEELSSEGVYIGQFGSKGSGNGQFEGPSGIASDTSTGHIFVSDKGDNRVEVFTSSGAFLGQFGSNGVGNGQFAGPIGIAINSSGDVYVVDSGNARIEKFIPGGC
jgi:DNA-binding beta-propeller fold protein YncE